MFHKVLIANRGEIALRILRACRELGIQTVAVHSTADADAMHVRLADESVCIGPAPSTQSYLNAAAILTAAEISGAQAIHPGFGFLSENANFARMVQDHGLTFIGPSPDHISVMGSKARAKQKAVQLGLSVIEGSDGQLKDLDQAQDLAEKLGYPVLLKAIAGGGGKGMRVVWRQEELKPLFENAQAEAVASFGEGGLYMEKFLKSPRHIEFQVLADHHGNVVCLGDRDCSIQRNHQKIWEEAPSCALSSDQRAQMIDLVCRSIKTFGYRNAGTLEFLYENGQFYFIEMNTRIQVEHPVTEMITGIDLVQEQIKIAAGLPLSFRQEDVQFRGHAIECRINAEDPITFMPSPGKIDVCLPPGGPFVRVDSPLYPGYKVPPYYDSMVAKLIVHGPDRAACLARLKGALDEYVITGIQTLIPLHRRLCEIPDVQAGTVHVKWLEQVYGKSPSTPPQDSTPQDTRGPLTENSFTGSLLSEDAPTKSAPRLAGSMDAPPLHNASCPSDKRLGVEGFETAVQSQTMDRSQVVNTTGTSKSSPALTGAWVWSVLAAAFAATGCTGPAPKPQGAEYLASPRLLLPAGKIQFICADVSAPHYTYVRISLADMLTQWSRDGIAPAGGPDTLVITITDASVQEEHIPKTSGFSGLIRVENTERYTARIQATFHKQTAGGMASRKVTLSAQAQRYAPENCTLDNRRRLMVCLYEDVLNQFSKEVQRIASQL